MPSTEKGLTLTGKLHPHVGRYVEFSTDPDSETFAGILFMGSYTRDEPGAPWIGNLHSFKNLNDENDVTPPWITVHSISIDLMHCGDLEADWLMCEIKELEIDIVYHSKKIRTLDWALGEKQKQYREVTLALLCAPENLAQ